MASLLKVVFLLSENSYWADFLSIYSLSLAGQNGIKVYQWPWPKFYTTWLENMTTFDTFVLKLFFLPLPSYIHQKMEFFLLILNPFQVLKSDIQFKRFSKKNWKKYSNYFYQIFFIENTYNYIKKNFLKYLYFAKNLDI